MVDIPQEVFDLYNETVVDFIDSNFGVDCTIIYKPNRIQCINCEYNPLTKSSSGVYKSGGPISFNGTICPYCDGAGYKLDSSTDTIKLRVYYNKKDFLRVGLPFAIKDGMIQTIGHITDMPKLLRSQEMIANSSVEGYSIYRYVLSGNITPWGLGPDKKFCIAYWTINQ